MTEVKKKRGRPKGSGLIGINRLLTRKQELFVKELVSKDGQITKRQAAINAGYPEGSAHSKAYSAATQCEIARGRAHGDIYVTKSEIRHGSIDQMDREQVMKALEELKTEFGTSVGNVIDVTPEKEEKDQGKHALATP